ncbi:response regulator [Candidatus Dojkabacteria bacterium]|uniref:Response regulator n=1 Tax=Candidatus Dojkabacteria bacterium TaxID=2099670 RepID=A0A955L672_9BACT|nr:response regulator [Candidatus Dojkabacteria bacterium]
MKIVLVDDNYAIRQLIKSILGDLDNSIEIFSSSDGIEGLGLVYTINPDLIILDTTLPKYSGKEVYEFLLENNGYANQIIIIS